MQEYCNTKLQKSEAIKKTLNELPKNTTNPLLP